MDSSIREPRQKRAIEKKEKIIDAGFALICDNGYYNINTAEIAKKAGVSTGIVYQYFKDKHDIFMEGLEKYGDDIFYPMIRVPKEKFDINNFSNIMKDMVCEHIMNHKVSKTAHEEIMSMVHSDSDVARYFYKRELELTNVIKSYLIENNFNDNYLSEKVHIMIGIIDNLCHEIIYHKHEQMNYEVMTDLVINNIKELFKNGLIK